MTSYIAFEAPAWLWILACFALFAAGIAFGALAAYALRIAREPDVEREFGAVHERLAKLEAPEPIPVRLEAPATIREEPIELLADGDTLPPVPWYTQVSP
jgi:hypothetical protein